MAFLSPFIKLFLGDSPVHFKWTIVIFLVANPILYFSLIAADVQLAGFIMGWIFMIQFIYTLVMAFHCYPLQSGGFLAIEAVILGLTSPQAIFHEIEINLDVILLLMFMVAAIYFLRDLLFAFFSNPKIYRLNRYAVSVGFLVSSAILSAFLDALTVTAVIITVFTAIHTVVVRHEPGDRAQGIETMAMRPTAVHGTGAPKERSQQEIEDICTYLQKLTMFALVGTACGGVSTLVGEPQNILVGDKAGWDFITFAMKIAPSTIMVGLTAIPLVLILERTGWFGYKGQANQAFFETLDEIAAKTKAEASSEHTARLWIQGISGLILCFGLVFHIASIGLIGLMVLVLATGFSGKVNEHDLGPSFQEALPFTALLVVFFCVISVINSQHLFDPVINYLTSLDDRASVLQTFISTGILSAVSGSLFAAGVFISEFEIPFKEGLISAERFDLLARAIIVGSNIPSVATPNGQAAFLFLLLSPLAPRIGLSYLKMLYMAIPFAVLLTISAFGSMLIQT